MVYTCGSKIKLLVVEPQSPCDHTEVPRRGPHTFFLETNVAIKRQHYLRSQSRHVTIVCAVCEFHLFFHNRTTSKRRWCFSFCFYSTRSDIFRFNQASELVITAVLTTMLSAARRGTHKNRSADPLLNMSDLNCALHFVTIRFLLYINLIFRKVGYFQECN